MKLVLSIETKEDEKELPDSVKDFVKELPDVLKNVQKDVLKQLSERQINILKIIVDDSKATLQEMSKRLKVSVKTIQRDFEVMKSLGISVVRKDGKTYGEWVIVISRDNDAEER